MSRKQGLDSKKAKRIASALALIFVKMKAIYNIPIGKRQRDFLQELFRVVFALQGRLSFTNMARFSRLHEQTFRRHFARAFDWVAFNLVILHLRTQPDEVLIGVFDTSFLPKSGKKTYGLDKFFSSAAKAIRTGLEVSLLGVVATTSRRSWALDATQTPPGLSMKETAPAYSRIDFYLEQITDCLACLPEVRYWVGDGYYAKAKVFESLTGCGKDLIAKLRSDANLRFLAQCHERYSGGRPRLYAGKGRFADFDSVSSRFSEEGYLPDLPHIRIYTALVNSEHFKRDLRIKAFGKSVFVDLVGQLYTRDVQHVFGESAFIRTRLGGCVWVKSSPHTRRYSNGKDSCISDCG